MTGRRTVGCAAVEVPLGRCVSGMDFLSPAVDAIEILGFVEIGCTISGFDFVPAEVNDGRSDVDGVRIIF